VCHTSRRHPAFAGRSPAVHLGPYQSAVAVGFQNPATAVSCRVHVLRIRRRCQRKALAGGVQAVFLADSQVPWDVDALGGAVDEPAWRVKPTRYLVAADDRMIPPPAQRGPAQLRADIDAAYRTKYGSSGSSSVDAMVAGAAAAATLQLSRE